MEDMRAKFEAKIRTFFLYKIGIVLTDARIEELAETLLFETIGWCNSDQHVPAKEKASA